MEMTPQQQARAELARRELARRAQAKPSGQTPAMAATPPAQSAVAPDDSFLPSLQETADFLQPLSDAAGRIQGSMPIAAGVVNPALGLAQYAGSKMNEASGRVGEGTAERLGAAGVNPYAAAGAGMAASIVSNPQTWMSVGGGVGQGRIMKPTVPAARAFDVATAEKYGLPMTRADRTGNINTARAETALARTLTGGHLFQKVYQEKLAAIEKAKGDISSRFGTKEPPSSAGLDVKLGMQENFGQAYKTAQGLYEKAGDPKIHVGNFEKAYNDLDYGSIDKSAMGTINELRGRLSGQAPATEATTPTSFGSKTRSYETEIPAQTKMVPGEGNVFEPGRTAKMESKLVSQHRVGPTSPDLPIISDAANKTGEPYAVFQGNFDLGDEGGAYSTYIVRGDHPQTGGNFSGADISRMGIKIKGRTQKAADMGEVPVQTPSEAYGDVSGPPGFQKINDVRNRLSREIQSDTTYNPITGNVQGPKAQALSKLKKALDQDLSEYVKQSRANKEQNPLGNMEANEFDTAFTRANTFYGDYKNLKNNKFVQKLSKVPESDVAKTIFAGGRIEDVNVAKAAMGQKGFEAAKKQYFNELLESKNIENTLSKESQEFLKGVFNDKELHALKEADSLKKTSLTAEKMAGNPSGTAQVASTLGTGGVLLTAASQLLTHPIAAGATIATVLGVPYAASKSYLGWGSKGVPASFGKGSAIATRTAGNAGQSSQDRLKEFAKRYIKIIK